MVGVDDFDNIFSFSLFSGSQPWKAFLEDPFTEGFFVSFWTGVSDLIEEDDIYAFDLGFSLGVV